MIYFMFYYGDRKIFAIENVPTQAIAIVEKYQPGFSECPVREGDGSWTEFSDLSFRECSSLMKDLAEHGHEATFKLYESRLIAASLAVK